MVDSHTRQKLFHEGYCATVPINFRQSEFLRLKKYYLSSEPNKGHNCTKRQRNDDNEDDWLIFLLSFGLQQATMDLNQMTDLKNGNQFLRHVKLEIQKDSFSFPKSICCTRTGNIYVADTGNNRVLGFNISGVQTCKFDEFEYKESVHRLEVPLALCSLVNDNIAVCNYGNSTVNIISENCTNRIMFICTSKPISIGSDNSGSIFVLTETGNIEEFSKSGKMIRVTTIKNRTGRINTIMAVGNKVNEIYLGRCNCAEVCVVSKLGDELRYLTLNITGSGLSVFTSNLSITEAGDILVTDSVNRSVHAFDARTGQYKATLINGKTGLGCVQSVCAMSVPGRLLCTTEYSLNQSHCVRIFSCANVDSTVDDE